MRNINIVFDQTNQCPYIRFANPTNYNFARYREMGIHFHLNPKEIDEEDSVVFERPASEELMEMQREMYASSKMPVLMDFDDATWNLDIFEHTDEKNREAARKHYKQVQDLMANHCDGIIVSTFYLGQEAQKVTKKPILVMPNAVNPNFAPTKHHKTILYAGAGNRNNEFTDEWIDAIKEMKKKGYKFISTTSLGIEDEKLPMVNPYDHYNRLRYYAPEYYVAPLEDSELNRGRSNLKELEAASINAKFIGGINAKPDFKNAKIPTLDPHQDYTNAEYAADFLTAYSGIWLMNDKMAAEWKSQTKLMGK